jgi:hypothetical protein
VRIINILESKNVFDVNILHYCIIAIVLNQV